MKIIFSFLLVFTFAYQGQAQSKVAKADYVSFTLLNRSVKDIPLKIPGYMNPNLSPMSNSGVTVKLGQEIFFKYRGKKRLLLIASKELEGQELIVNKLIQEKKRAIDSGE